MNGRLRKARVDRGWSQSQLHAELQRVARRRGEEIGSRNTLKSLLSRWENGRTRPDEFNRSLLREVFGMDDDELGFVETPSHIPAAYVELKVQLSLERGSRTELVKSLISQTEALRQQDRTYGAPHLLEQMRGLVNSLEFHLSRGVFDEERRVLARILADAAALAGWQAMDVGAIDQAWRSFETATLAAREAEDVALWAFARLEQAQVLVELDSVKQASEVAQAVWNRCEAQVSDGVRCWVAAALAEMRALIGDDTGSRAFIATAERLADQLDAPLPPYLVFDRLHLDRWIGHTLMILDDHHAAIPRLRRALAKLDRSFSRAGASLHLDLAAALTKAGENDEAREHLDLGKQLAVQIGSRRQLDRAQQLLGVG